MGQRQADWRRRQDVIAGVLFDLGGTLIDYDRGSSWGRDDGRGATSASTASWRPWLRRRGRRFPAPHVEFEDASLAGGDGRERAADAGGRDRRSYGAARRRARPALVKRCVRAYAGGLRETGCATSSPTRSRRWPTFGAAGSRSASSRTRSSPARCTPRTWRRTGC